MNLRGRPLLDAVASITNLSSLSRLITTGFTNDWGSVTCQWHIDIEYIITTNARSVTLSSLSARMFRRKEAIEPVVPGRVL